MNQESVSNFAITLHSRHSLTPPICVESIVNQYAELIFAEIPIDGVDGITLNLKVKDVKSKVIVNSNNHKVRQRFTLAHELGHLIIPWHIGNIIDSLNTPEDLAYNSHWQIENEANIFASEFLMPTDWVKSAIQMHKNLSNLHSFIADSCDVSLQAAAIKLTPLLPPNIVFAVTKGNIVKYSGKTDGTFASAPQRDCDLQSNLYSYALNYYSKKTQKQVLHWWELPNTMSIVSTDTRPWRVILAEIIEDLPEYSNKKTSINGIIAGINGRKKSSNLAYSVETLTSSLIQRFNNDKTYINLINHPKFESFLYQRIKELIV